MLKAEREPARTRFKCHPSICIIPPRSLFRHQQYVCGALNASVLRSRRCWRRKAIVMIDRGHMWRLWSGYVAAQNCISWIFSLPPSPQQMSPPPLLCYLFVRERSTLITILCFWGLAAAEALFSGAIILFIGEDKAVFVLDSSADGLLTFFPLE